MSQHLITIAQFSEFSPAGLAQSILEAEGITCFLDNQHLIGMNWLYSNALGGIKLKVAASDAELAQDILAAYSTPPQNVQRTEVEQLAASACPNCGATEIETIDYKRKSAALSLLLTLPLFIFAKRYQCSACGHKWK